MASIQEVRTVDNPQRAYEFEVEILAVGAAGSLPLLTERVSATALPEKSVDTIVINYKGRKTTHAGRDSSPATVTITFWDDETRRVYNFFHQWMEEGISDSTVGGGGSRDEYSTEIVIRTYAHDSTLITGQTRLTKAFPTSIGEVTLNYEASEHHSFDVTFSFDQNLVV